MDELHQRIANLSPEKRALLEQRLLQQSALRTKEQSIPRRQIHSSYPLSFAQQRLWFLAQLEPDGAAYHVSQAVRIRGCLSIVALQRTLDAIVARHEALRTTIVAVDGNPMQVVQEQRTVPLDVRELCGLDEGERETVLACQLTREAQRRFNLAADVMLRATLFHLEPEEYVLFLVMHHIASDGWSMGVLMRELGALYRAFATGEAPTLSPLPMQYADYAIWQQQWLQGEVLATQIAYWTQQLSGAPAVLELPTDFPRPAVQTSRGRRHTLTISAAVTEALKALSCREGATLFMTLLAAWQVLLYRYTGQADISIGTPIAGRIRTEMEPLIGFFVNTLVLRTDLTGDPTFRELLRRVREVAMGAYAHQELPFEKLVEALQPEQNLSHAPLFQVMFAFQNVPRQTLELPGLVLTPLEVEHATAQFDMSLSLWEADDGLAGSLEYNTDLFAAETMRRLIGHFSTLLAGIVGDSNQRLSTLPLITAAEQHQMLVTWNATQAAPTSVSSLPGLLDGQAARTPTAVAVEAGEKQLTYEALHWRANQVARYLQSLGVGPEVRVALYMHRSLDMLIGLLGIVKAGGTYVPLDPAIPTERLAFIIDDAAVAVVLTQQALAEQLPRRQVQVVCFDTAWAVIALENEQPCDSRVAGEHGAYIIYTSGTTGIPKGVLIAQQSVVNYVEAAATVFALGPADRILQCAAITFDVAAEEIFCCLSRGATLVLRADAMVETVATFIQRCWDWRLTVLDLPTAYWHELATQLAETSLALPPTVRLVIIGGEKARREKLDLWWQRIGAGVRLVNAYGPTETTIASTLAELTPTTEGALAGREVSVGRPIAHMQAYVLDRWLQPGAVGISGELYLGGVGLAQGYVNQPALTAARFIPHPFSRHPGARLYKTGDMARYRADGCLEILGRVDDQVKVRGFRIELGEIETVLATHPTVRQVVVVTQEGPSEGQRLVAYLVPQHSSIPHRRGTPSLCTPEAPCVYGAIDVCLVTGVALDAAWQD